MRLMMTFVALALALGSTACSKKSGAGEAISKMTEFKDRMCACKDKACIDKVNEDMNKWGSEQKGGQDTKVNEDDAKKMAAVSEEMSKCMTKVMTDSAMAGSGSAGSGSDMAGSGSGSAMAGSGSDQGSNAMAGSGSDAQAMLHHAGMCPSTVLGATTTAAVKGKAVVVTVTATDKAAIQTIQKRADELLAEKKDAKTGTAHDQKGTFGGSKGMCPVYVPEGAKATAKKDAKGVVVTITPTDKPDVLKTEIDGRITKTSDWVKANIKEGDKASQGGVGGGKGPEKSNHSGQGDAKGKDRKGSGSGGGGGTGGGGGKGTGGGGGGGSGSGSGAKG